MANVKQLEVMLKSVSTAGLVPNIIGRHGIGKSEITRATYEKLGYRVIDIRLGQMADAGDLVGLPEFDRDEAMRAIATRFVTPDKFPKHGEQAVIFFDEINRGTKDILQAIFELVLDKNMGDYSMDTSIIQSGPGKGMPTQILAAGMNPPTGDYSTLDFSDKAFQDRFVHVKFEPTVQEWAAYQRSRGMSAELVAFYVDQPAMLEKKGEAFSLDQVEPSRRSAEHLDRLFKMNLTKDVFTELAYGLMGTQSTVALQTFLANYDKSLKASDVLNKFATVEARIIEYSKSDNDRQDILNNTVDEVKAFILDKGKLNKTQQLNLVKFMMLLPTGTALGAAQKLFLSGEVTPIFVKCAHIVNNPDLTEFLKKVNRAKLKAKSLAEEETKKAE